MFSRVAWSELYFKRTTIAAVEVSRVRAENLVTTLLPSPSETMYSCGDSDKWSDSACVMKVETTDFPDSLGV